MSFLGMARIFLIYRKIRAVLMRGIGACCRADRVVRPYKAWHKI